MPQNAQNKISQTTLKRHNQFRSVKNDILRLLKITTDTGNKIKVETESKERDQKLL